MTKGGTPILSEGTSKQTENPNGASESFFSLNSNLVSKISGKIMSNLTLKSMLHSNTMWAFKAEKGSEFIAAHQPGPYSHQQLADNN